MFTVFKRIFVIFVIMFALQAIFFGFSFAQDTGKVICEENPTVCSVPPKEFGYYVDFTKEMLQAINTVQGKGKNLGEYNYIGGLFTNKILSIPEENKNLFEKMVAGIKESMDRKISTTLGLANILSSLTFTAYKDVLGFAILIQARPIVRDWKTLLDLETNTNDIVYELSLSAMANQQIIDPYKFQKIIDKYSQDKPLFDQGSVSEETKYKDITNMLIRLNGAMKTFIPYGRIQQFDEFRKGGEGGIYLKFNTDTIQEMKDEYSCARWFKCTSSWKDFVKNIKNLGSSFKKGGNNAKKTITDANKKLAESIKGIGQAKILKKSAGEEYLTDTEIELLRDVYGIDTKKLTEQEGIGLRDLLQVPTKGTLNEMKAKIKGAQNELLDKQAKANAEAAKREEEKKDKKKIEDLLAQNAELLKGKIKEDSTKDVVVDLKLEKAFRDVINIVNNQQKNDLDVLWSTTSVDFLAYYTNIGYRIREVIGIISIGEQSIVKNLGNICEFQCSNKGIDGCYAK